MAVGNYRILGYLQKKDGKSLLDSMGIWDSKYVQDIIWLYDTIGFQDIYRKSDGN